MMKSMLKPTQPHYFNWIVEVDNTHLRDNTVVFLRKTSAELRQEVKRRFGSKAIIRLKSRTEANQETKLSLSA